MNSKGLARYSEFIIHGFVLPQEITSMVQFKDHMMYMLRFDADVMTLLTLLPSKIAGS
jgi:hypothetical protein